MKQRKWNFLRPVSSNLRDLSSILKTRYYILTLLPYILWVHSSILKTVTYISWALNSVLMFFSSILKVLASV